MSECAPEFAATTALIALVIDAKACAKRLDELQRQIEAAAKAQAKLDADREQHEREVTAAKAALDASLDFSNLLVHRGRESENAVVLQQFLSGSGTPRCRHSVRWSGLNLKRLRAAQWLPASMAATSPRMRVRCCWGKSIAAWA
jgi:hypothetical protein